MLGPEVGLSNYLHQSSVYSGAWHVNRLVINTRGMRDVGVMKNRRSVGHFGLLRNAKNPYQKARI